MAGEQEPGRGAGNGEQENGIWLENRNRDAARGTGNRRTGFAWRTGMEDAAEGDGEQENGIGLENGN